MNRRTFAGGDDLVHDVIGHRDPRTFCGAWLIQPHDPIDDFSTAVITCVVCIGKRTEYDAWETSVADGTAPAQLSTRLGRRTP